MKKPRSPLAGAGFRGLCQIGDELPALPPRKEKEKRKERKLVRRLALPRRVIVKHQHRRHDVATIMRCQRLCFQLLVIPKNRPVAGSRSTSKAADRAPRNARAHFGSRWRRLSELDNKAHVVVGLALLNPCVILGLGASGPEKNQGNRKGGEGEALASFVK